VRSYERVPLRGPLMPYTRLSSGNATPFLFLIRSLLLLQRPVGNITGREHRMDCEKREDVRIEVKSKGRKKQKKKET